MAVLSVPGALESEGMHYRRIVCFLLGVWLGAEF